MNAHVIIPDVPLRSEPVGLEEEGKGRKRAGGRKDGKERGQEGKQGKEGVSTYYKRTERQRVQALTQHPVW